MILTLAVAGAAAQPPAVPPDRYVVDRGDRFSPEAELELERLLRDHHRGGGLRVVLASERGGGGVLGAVESGDGGEAAGRWVVLVDTGSTMEWGAGPAVRLDPGLMRFVGERYITPRKLPPGDRDAGMVERVQSAVEVIETAATGRAPFPYLAWRLLEAPPDTAGMPFGVTVALRYLVVVLLMAPWLAVLAVVAGPLLVRVGWSSMRVNLAALALAVVLTGAALALALTAGSERLGALFPYAVASALAFLLATPLHLLLARHLAAGTERRFGWFLLAYLLFPLAVAVAAVALRRVGEGGEWRPWLPLSWRRRR